MWELPLQIFFKRPMIIIFTNELHHNFILPAINDYDINPRQIVEILNLQMLVLLIISKYIYIKVH